MTNLKFKVKPNEGDYHGSEVEFKNFQKYHEKKVDTIKNRRTSKQKK